MPSCSRNEEKSVGERVTDLAEHLAAAIEHDRFGVTLERTAEGIVGGEEEPGVAAALDDRVAVALRQRPSVVDPMDSVGRAGLAGRSEVAGPTARNALFLSRMISLTASATDGSARRR